MALEATVSSQLKFLGDVGVDYMKLQSPDAGALYVLPAPNLNGLRSQASAKISERVKAELVGGRRDGIQWAVLLNQGGQQYGQPMQYDNLNVPGVVHYIGNGQTFPRSGFKTEQGAGNSSANVVLPTGKNMRVRYSGLTNFDDFQGFVVSIRGGDGAIHRVWMPLTLENVRGASTDRNYNNLVNMMGPGFSFIQNSNLAHLKSLVTGEPANVVLVYSGNRYVFQVPSGQRTLSELIAELGGRGRRGKEADAIKAYAGHLEQNQPLKFGGVELSKNAEVVLQPGDLVDVLYSVPVVLEPVATSHTDPTPRAYPRPGGSSHTRTQGDSPHNRAQRAEATVAVRRSSSGH